VKAEEAAAAEREELREKRSKAMESAKPLVKESKKDNPYLRPFGRLSTAELEALITDTEIELANLQEQVAGSDAFKNLGRAKAAHAEHEGLVKKLEQLEAEYFERAG
jgi:hypothetical protein